MRHWRGDIVAFHTELIDRYAPSMRQRIELDGLWRSAREQALLAYQGTPQQDALSDLPETSPVELDDLLAERIDSAAPLERLHAHSG